MQIHATNINGLGASQVVISFLEAAEELGVLENAIIYLPETGALSRHRLNTGTFKSYKRILPNAFSRLLEVIFSKFIFKNIETIVLGDIPLRGIDNQIVLVHQLNLVYPSVNSYSSKSLNFRVNRFLFSINHKFAKKIIVQTGAMAEEMIVSYPQIKDKIIISPQPVPNWLSSRNNNNIEKSNKIKFFYPAAFYPHKKHVFLLGLDIFLKNNKIDHKNFEIWVTLKDEEFEAFKKIKFLKNLGRLNTDEMNSYYSKCDSLLFLSSMESYGLPLLEALTLNLPILVADFKYSRWMCEDSTYYFKPYSNESFVLSLNEVIKDIQHNKIRNFKNVLNKFPDNWEEVVHVFINALNN